VNSISEEVDVSCVRTSIFESNLLASDSGVVVKFILEITIDNKYLRRNVCLWLTPAELVSRSIGMLDYPDIFFAGHHAIFDFDLKWK
jgi:hypothetical protein